MGVTLHTASGCYCCCCYPAAGVMKPVVKDPDVALKLAITGICTCIAILHSPGCVGGCPKQCTQCLLIVHCTGEQGSLLAWINSHLYTFWFPRHASRSLDRGGPVGRLLALLSEQEPNV